MWVVWLWIAFAALAGAQDLDEVRTSLAALRGVPHESPAQTRGATPAFTTIKHQLRDWVEARIASYDPLADEREMERQLNRDLEAAGLFCGNCDSEEGWWWPVGYLDPVRLIRPGQFLGVITSLGIECGSDDSLYLYRHSAAGWERVLESETNNYSQGQYFPQSIADVRVANTRRDPNPFTVMTLGYEAWCSSNWHAVFYRVWRIYGQAYQVVDGRERAFSPEDAKGAVSFSEAWFEFGTEDGLSIRHFTIPDEGPATLTDPLALSPQGFVIVWLKAPWSFSESWSDGPGLERAHAEAKPDLEFLPDYPVWHCTDRPDLWQVDVPEDYFFLVRWRPPYRFRMVEVRRTPAADCTERDPAADKSRSLFLNQ